MPDGTETVEKPRTKEERAIEKLQEAISGYSPKSKNALIKEAIRILKD